MDERFRRVGFETRDFGRCRDSLAVAERALSLLTSVLTVPAGSFWAVEGKRLARVASVGGEETAGVVPLPPPPGSLLAGLLENCQTISVANPSAAGAALPASWRESAGGALLATACADTTGAVRAVLCLRGPDSRPFDEQERDIVHIVSAHAAEALLGLEITTQLRTAEQTMRQLVERTLAGIWLLQDERTLYANPRIAEMLGLPASEAGTLFGRPVPDFVHPDDRAWLRAAARRRTLPASAAQLDEIRLLRADGGLTWAEVLPTLVQHDERPALLLHAVDVSARKRAEEEKDQLEARFLQAQKMEAIGRLAGGVAHDFNNLLMAISGHTELLARRIPQEQHRHLDHIRKATEQAAGLTRQLLAFSRMQVLQTELVSLNDVVSATHKLLRRIIGEDVSLVLQLDPEAEPIRTDPTLIGQVLMNLAVNARDSMPQGGTLTIETAGLDLATPVPVASPPLRPGRYLRLSVTDTGVGMTEDVLDRLFEPFFTTKERGKGTGLGLAMVYGTVKQSDGHIGVETAPGEGTTFRLYFPPASLQADATLARGDAARGSETILAVEDEGEVRDLLASMLEGLGYRVVTAPDADAAQRVFLELEGAVDLLLTDVVLPGTNGPKLGQILRERCPELRVLYVSGYLDDGGPGKGLPEGSLLLRKPFSLEDLAAAVRGILDAAPS